MNFKKYIYIAAVALGMGVTFAACSDDDLDPNSIFDDSEGQLDPTSPTYQLDKFCDDSLRVPYNCALIRTLSIWQCFASTTGLTCTTALFRTRTS